ncbi:MAG: Ig-like domain-containing protein, partial [Vicinamibacterales bacterium]|nr:Ig-like domain-containing protein [Vicinamibacterales bacterium]
EIGRIPVGSILVEAVDTTRPASIFVAEDIPFAGAIVTRDLVLLDVDTTGVVVKYGALTGRVLRRDGLTPVTDVPVIAYYANRSQADVRCPPPPGGHNEPAECAVAVVRSDASGAFAFPHVVAGSLRVYSFDQGALAEGEVRIGLPADGSFDFNLLIGGGLGKVHGVVVDRDGRPVTDARVGGGLTLTAVDAQGRFTLVDVPVGRREIVAVSDAIQSTGSAFVDLVREGEQVNVTIVLESIGGVAGIVSLHDGRPAAGITVYALQECYDAQGNPQICVAGQAVTGATGAYRIDKLLVGRYSLSAFTANMSDGNVADVAVRYHRQVVKADITFRGGGGRVSGVVYAADGVTPLRARVAISGDRLVTAGGRVGVRFQYVQNFAVVDTDFTTGRFQFDGVWVGPFTVRAAGQFSPDPVTVQGTMPEEGAEVELALRLQPTSRVTGTVYLPDGVTRAPAGVPVTFKSDAVIVICTEDAFGIGTCQTIPQGVQEMFAVTDAQGQFLLSPVNAGAFTLTAEHPATQRLAQVKGSVRAGEEADINVRLLGRAPVLVRVVGSDGATAIPGAQVSLNQIDYPRVSRQALADAAGLALFSGGDAVGEGEFVVAAVDMRNGFAGRATGRVTIDGQQVNVVVRLADATGTVSGTVYRDDGLTPVPNAEVVVSQGGHSLAFAVTDANGDYSVTLVPLGAFAVDVFDASTAARGYDAGQLTYDGQQFVLPIRLDPLGLLKGTVVESLTLAPLKGWEVGLTQVSRSGRRLPERRTTAGVDGSFSFPGATVGGFTLVARHRTVVGSGTASGEIARAGQVVDVPLVVTIVRRVVGTVAGTVFNPDGSPAGNAQVELCAASEPCRFSAAAANGTFSFGDVPLGRFTARAKAQLTGNVSVGLVVGDLFFEGDTAEVAITLVGLATIEGTVVDAGGSPAARVDVALYGSPGSGCPGPCQQATDALGRFRFVDVPARTFTVVATDPLSGLRGSVGDVVGPGETRTVQVRLQPGARVTGRVLLSSGAAGKGVVVELSRGSMRLFAEADASGAFLFESVALGSITLSAQDPVGPGTARRSEVLVGDFDFGDIVLDDASPAVGSVTPAGGAIDVALASTVRIAFTEPVTLSTALAPGAIVLTGPEGDVAGFVEVVPGSSDSALTFHPLSALRDQARYTLRVSGVQDRVGKAMAAPYTSTFTTIDLTVPSVVEATPLAGTSGVSIVSVVRVKYDEPVNPAKYRGPPVTLTGPAGAVEGRTDFAFGNTTLVFTPARPLSQDATYRVDLAPATDVAGNEQPAGSRWTFTTTDGTPPVVVSLDGPGGPTSCAAPLGAKQNTTVTLVAQTVPADVAFVDFFIGGVPASVDRLPPFTSSFEVTDAYGRPGDIIRVAAVATDTSGNRGTALETCVSVLADLAPAVELLAPLAGASARNGQEVAVTVKATDDLGLTQVGFAARTGRPQDAAARTLAGPALERTEHFAFVVPAGAAPGSLIVVEASARDTRGQVTTGAPVELRVLDGVAPAVTLSGFAPGARLQPGQTATVVLSAEDAGGVSSIGVSVSGAAALSQTREVAPAQPTVVSSFTFTVSPDATPADRVTIDGFATDASGNSGTAVRLVVEIADQSPPTVTLAVAGGAAATLVPGRATTLVAEADDDLGVARIVISGSGAFAYSDAKTFSPPLAQAAAGFVVNAPTSLVPGSVVTVQARAVDVSGNLSQPASLTLTGVALAEVVLPPSLIVRAGESVGMQVSLAAAAPAGGLTVTFAASASGIVAVPGPVTFAEGEVS